MGQVLLPYVKGGLQDSEFMYKMTTRVPQIAQLPRQWKMWLLSDYQTSVSRHEMWNGGHSCMKCTPWITSFKNSGWRYRYLSTKANVILLVSWPAKSTSKMLSLMSSTLMKLPSSFEDVSKTERRSWLTEAFPSFKSCTQNSSCHFQIDWSHRLNP